MCVLPPQCPHSSAGQLLKLYNVLLVPMYMIGIGSYLKSGRALVEGEGMLAPTQIGDSYRNVLNRHMTGIYLYCVVLRA